jgi:hypothetical protein
MKTSESISKITAALLKAQKAITFAAKDATNPHFKSKYADLPTVIDAVKPALNDNGIVFLQTPTPSEPGTLALTTRLLHESGEWIEDTAITPLQKSDPQGYGSAITYLRRYSLASAVGLYQDDDDGNAASNAPANHGKQPNRTLVMKIRQKLQEHIANDRPLGVVEEWDAAREQGEEFAGAVWSGLTTPERDYIRSTLDQQQRKAA